ncbi:MAG: hypothetical protein KDJ75_07210 [Alphaproteobacteria bacterium]|nr:hypothetical protein [Alphaproteobacteria bacterium]
MGIEIDLMANGSPAQSTDNLATSRSGTPVRLTPDDIGDRVLANAAYHFAGFAGEQITGDGKFFDRSGQDHHALRGADLSDANMFANSGYISTVDPATGVTDSTLHIPSLNFDYAGGEKLILWWLGKTTAEGSSVSWMGDGVGAAYNGIRIRANSNQSAQLALYNSSTHPGGLFGGSTSDMLFDGNLHSFGLFLDGENKEYGYWVDEAFDSAFGADYLTLGAGASVDTTNANTWNIGTAYPAIALPTDGIATQTRALHILRLPSGTSQPSVAAITTLFEKLRAHPSSLILGRAL